MTPRQRSLTGAILFLTAGALLFTPGRHDSPCSACRLLTPRGASAESPVRTQSVSSISAANVAPATSSPHEQHALPPVAPAIEAFNEWTSRFLAADADDQRPLISEGVRLARERRRVMADMIQSNPQRALELTLPHAVRRQLPPEITELVEQRVNARAEYRVAAVLPVAGGEDRVPPMLREALIGSRRYAVFTHGAGLSYVTKRSVPVNGIAVPAAAATNPPDQTNGAPDHLLALDSNPVRVLDASETQEFLDSSATTPPCPESGDEITVRDTPGVVEYGGELVPFCGPDHMRQWAASAIDGAGLDTPDVAASGGGVAASGYTEGYKRMLFLRVRFADSGSATADTMNDTVSDNLLDDMVGYMNEMSFRRFQFAPRGPGGSEITEPLLLDEPASFYNDAGLSRLYPDARSAASAAGWNLNNYQFFAVFTRGRPAAGYAGLAYVGGVGIHIANGYFGQHVLAHELGHNLGLPHAHSWDTGDNSIIGDGSNVEYGNGYDPIGSGGNASHYTGTHKRFLDWIPGGDANAVTAAGIYRLYAMDNVNGTQGLRTLRVSRHGSQDYSFDCREDFSDAQFQNGLFGHFCNKNGLQSYLLDFTPRQPNIALPVGRTFTDPDANVHVTPLRKANTFPKSIDVAVNFASQGNRAPRAIVTAHTPVVALNAPAHLTVAATDDDGDELAYSWDFGDNTYSMDNAPQQQHAWSADGEYVVQCIVSDLKGGIARHSVIVSAGSPPVSQFRISGRVLDAANKPLAGIRVYTDADHYAWSASDGSYTLTRLPAGNTTVKARELVKGVLSFGRIFPDPINLAANYTGADFAISGAPPEILTQIVPALSTWKYNDTGTNLQTAWRAPAYADGAWASGPGILGYGNTGEGTVISFGPDANNKRPTAYFRKSFTVADRSVWDELRLQCKRDDMVIVYLNGTRIFEDNLPDNVTPDTVSYNTRARDSVEPNDYLVRTGLATTLLVNGTNVLAAEVHQVEPTSSDLAFDAALLGVKQTPNPGATAAYLDKPEDGQRFVVPLASLALTATAHASAAAVTKVEFFANGAKLGEDTASPFQFTWPKPPAGAFGLHVVATFATGTPVTSGLTRITIGDPPLPLLSSGEVWRYYASDTAPLANWNLATFSDAAWPQGSAQLGYGDGDETTAITGGPYLSTYFRRKIHVTDPASLTSLLARMIRDDAASVFLNGQLAWMSNFRDTGGIPRPYGAGPASLENSWHSQPLDPAIIRPGTNLIAVEVQQDAPTSSDLSFDFALEATGTPRAAGVYLTVPPSLVLTSSATLKAQAVVMSGRDVTAVEFFAGANRLGGDSTFPYEFTWPAPPAGMHSLTARLTDTTGAVFNSAPQVMTVTTQPQASALVSFGESWKYWDDGIEPGDWKGRTSYDDSAWPAGPARLGYGGDGEVTPLRAGTSAFRPVTVWFRRKFNVPNPAAFTSLRLRVVRDDGIAVHLNRTEILRDNLPEGLLTFATLASAGAADEQTPLEFIVPTTALRAGENQLAVEVHQSSATSSDLGFDLALSGLIAPAGNVWLTSPSAGERIHPGGGVPFAAATNGTVTKVEFFAGAAMISERTAPPWTFTWIPPLLGSYPVKARATFDGGTTLDSPPVPITVAASDSTLALVPPGADWRFLDTGVAPSAGWLASNFDDSGWTAGPARLGFGGDGEFTSLEAGHIVYWARRQFTVPAGFTLLSASMKVQRDDGLALYLDGTRVTKLNITDEPVTNTSLAATSIGNADETAWIDVPITVAALGNGLHQLAVSIHQQSPTSSDLGFDMDLKAVARPIAGLTNSAPSAPLRLTLTRQGPSQFNLTLPGLPGQVFAIESSGNLQSWTPLSTHILNSTSLSIVLTPGAEPTHYWRAKWLATP